MIHIATVHWKDDRFIDIQLGGFAKHIQEPFRVYAFLNDIDAKYDDKFFYASHEPVRDHATKLNLLADIIRFSADGEDLLIFFDGDAWPIAPFLPAIREKMKEFPLVAVCRRENGDPQPHPCFCVTTVGFWRAIRGDWKAGHTWMSENGSREVTDVGANLLSILERKRVEWCPLLRSNVVDLHPIMYGVYGGVVYHHGAGFREPVWRKEMFGVYDRHPVAGWLRRHQTSFLWGLLGYRKIRGGFVAQNEVLSKRVFNTILRNIDFPVELARQGARKDDIMRMLRD